MIKQLPLRIRRWNFTLIELLLVIAIITILAAYLRTHLYTRWRTRPCPGCLSPMRRRAILDGHVWVCGVCGRVRVAGKDHALKAP